MSIKVLVVDDSSFFRRRVSEILNADLRLEVIETAVNGQDALEKVIALKPDVVTMDIEMPVMDGITAVREIMLALPTPILIFSSLSNEGAKATLDALEAGALDFLPKNFEDVARNKEEAVLLLQQRVYDISKKRSLLKAPTPKPNLTAEVKEEVSEFVTLVDSDTKQKIAQRVRFEATGKRYQVLAIGASTGGPVALQKILTDFPESFPLPILLVQHMPATFTTAFAARLNDLCNIKVKEAKDGDELKPGVAYLAPGGMQMLVEGRPPSSHVKIMDSGDKVNYKPSVDITFGSLANVFHDKVLALVLTGMGVDGRDGAKLLKEQDATIWAQDEESCVVYGMPQAIAKVGISTENIPLDRISERIFLELTALK